MSILVATIFAFLAAALATAGAALLVAPRAGGGPRRARSGWGKRTLRGLAAAGRGFRSIGGRVTGGPGVRAAAAGGGTGGHPAIGFPGRVDAHGPRDLAARIVAAGEPAGIGPRELIGAKVVAALAAAILAAPLAAVAPGRLGPLVVVAVPAAGFLAPDLWLRRLAAARARQVRRQLPALLDLLRVSVEAGVSLPEALRAVGERADGPLATEWRAVGEQLALGVPLAHALETMARRLPLVEVRALVAALDRARRHGAPLAETLVAQARDARFSLARRVREEAARAGPKIQLIVALLLVPSVLLLVMAALLGFSGATMLPL